jgi:hypothetical protein
MLFNEETNKQWKHSSSFMILFKENYALLSIN